MNLNRKITRGIPGGLGEVLSVSRGFQEAFHGSPGGSKQFLGKAVRSFRGAQRRFKKTYGASGELQKS